MDKIIAKGWTQAYYSQLTGRHKRMISHFCSGERVMQPEDIHAACLIFGCEEHELHEWVINDKFLFGNQQAAD